MVIYDKIMDEDHMCNNCLKGRVRPLQIGLDQALTICDNISCNSFLNQSLSDSIKKIDTHKKFKHNSKTRTLNNGIRSDSPYSSCSTDQEVEYYSNKALHRNLTNYSASNLGNLNHTKEKPSNSFTQEDEEFFNALELSISNGGSYSSSFITNKNGQIPINQKPSELPGHFNLPGNNQIPNELDKLLDRELDAHPSSQGNLYKPQNKNVKSTDFISNDSHLGTPTLLDNLPYINSSNKSSSDIDFIFNDMKIHDSQPSTSSPKSTTSAYKSQHKFRPLESTSHINGVLQIPECTNISSHSSSHNLKSETHHSLNIVNGNQNFNRNNKFGNKNKPIVSNTTIQTPVPVLPNSAIRVTAKQKCLVSGESNKVNKLTQKEYKMLLKNKLQLSPVITLIEIAASKFPSTIFDDSETKESTYGNDRLCVPQSRTYWDALASDRRSQLLVCTSYTPNPPTSNKISYSENSFKANSSQSIEKSKSQKRQSDIFFELQKLLELDEDTKEKNTLKIPSCNPLDQDISASPVKLKKSSITEVETFENSLSKPDNYNLPISSTPLKNVTIKENPMFGFSSLNFNRISSPEKPHLSSLNDYSDTELVEQTSLLVSPIHNEPTNSISKDNTDIGYTARKITPNYCKEYKIEKQSNIKSLTSEISLQNSNLILPVPLSKSKAMNLELNLMNHTSSEAIKMEESNVLVATSNSISVTSEELLNNETCSSNNQKICDYSEVIVPVLGNDTPLQTKSSENLDVNNFTPISIKHCKFQESKVTNKDTSMTKLLETKEPSVDSSLCDAKPERVSNEKVVPPVQIPINTPELSENLQSTNNNLLKCSLDTMQNETNSKTSLPIMSSKQADGNCKPMQPKEDSSKCAKDAIKPQVQVNFTLAPTKKDQMKKKKRRKNDCSSHIAQHLNESLPNLEDRKTLENCFRLPNSKHLNEGLFIDPWSEPEFHLSELNIQFICKDPEEEETPAKEEPPAEESSPKIAPKRKPKNTKKNEVPRFNIYKQTFLHPKVLVPTEDLILDFSSTPTLTDIRQSCGFMSKSLTSSPEPGRNTPSIKKKKRRIKFVKKSSAEFYNILFSDLHYDEAFLKLGENEPEMSFSSQSVNDRLTPELPESATLNLIPKTAKENNCESPIDQMIFTPQNPNEDVFPDCIKNYGRRRRLTSQNQAFVDGNCIAKKRKLLNARSPVITLSHSSDSEGKNNVNTKLFSLLTQNQLFGSLPDDIDSDNGTMTPPIAAVVPEEEKPEDSFDSAIFVDSLADEEFKKDSDPFLPPLSRGITKKSHFNSFVNTLKEDFQLPVKRTRNHLPVPQLPPLNNKSAEETLNSNGWMVCPGDPRIFYQPSSQSAPTVVPPALQDQYDNLSFPVWMIDREDVAMDLESQPPRIASADAAFPERKFLKLKLHSPWIDDSKLVTKIPTFQTLSKSQKIAPKLSKNFRDFLLSDENGRKLFSPVKQLNLPPSQQRSNQSSPERGSMDTNVDDSSDLYSEKIISDNTKSDFETTETKITSNEISPKKTRLLMRKNRNTLSKKLKINSSLYQGEQTLKTRKKYTRKSPSVCSVEVENKELSSLGIKSRTAFKPKAKKDKSVIET